MIHVLVVENHELVRAGLRRILEESSEINQVSEVETGEQAIAACRQKPVDIVLLDINLPGLSAFEITRRLSHSQASAQVIVLAQHAKSPFPIRLLDAGARGYLTRDCGAAELLKAIRTVHSGTTYIGTEAAKQLALSILPGTAESPFDDLSAREMEVMLKLTQGTRVSDIASMMCLSPKTIATYKYRIYDKLGTRNEVGLLRMAMRYGLLEAS